MIYITTNFPSQKLNEKGERGWVHNWDRPKKDIVLGYYCPPHPFKFLHTLLSPPPSPYVLEVTRSVRMRDPILLLLGRAS